MAPLCGPRTTSNPVPNALDDRDWRLLRASEPAPAGVLSPRAAAWLDALPGDVRPAELAGRHPRLVDRFALSWDDPALTAFVLDDLMTDRRGGRQGFPPGIRAELARLRRFHEARMMQLARDAVRWAQPEGETR